MAVICYEVLVDFYPQVKLVVLTFRRRSILLLLCDQTIVSLLAGLDRASVSGSSFTSDTNDADLTSASSTALQRLLVRISGATRQRHDTNTMRFS